MICHPIYNDCRAHLVSTYALEVQDQTIRGRSLGWSMQGIPDPTKGPSLVDLDVLILQLLVVGQKIHEFPRNWCVLWESTGTPPKSPRFQGPKAHFFRDNGGFIFIPYIRPYTSWRWVGGTLRFPLTSGRSFWSCGKSFLQKKKTWGWLPHYNFRRDFFYVA